MDLRADIARVVDEWERKAHQSTYLSERLHAKARHWLLDHIETLLRDVGVSTVHLADKVAGANSGASKRASTAAPETPENTGSVPTMDDLKGKLKGQQKGQTKGTNKGSA